MSAHECISSQASTRAYIFLETTSNITEFKKLASKKMADAIQDREEYNYILPDPPIPMLVISPETLKHTDANKSALRILGLNSHDDIHQKDFLSFSASVNPDGTNSNTDFQRHLKKSLKNGFSEFKWFFHRTPEDRWYGDVALSGFHHGSTALLQMSIRDITKQQMEKYRRKKLEEQLRQAQKMESIGTLSGGIAHDFNNILFPVMGYTEMMLDDLPEDSSQHGPMQEVLKGCLREKDLVEQILTFSRQPDKEFKPLKIHLIVKEILKLSRASFPSTIEIYQNISRIPVWYWQIPHRFIKLLWILSPTHFMPWRNTEAR
jgi:hypothetical protein